MTLSGPIKTRHLDIFRCAILRWLVPQWLHNVLYRWVISIQEQTPAYQAIPFDSK
jgi:hypothetical protein